MELDHTGRATTLDRSNFVDHARFLPLDGGSRFSDADNNACEILDTHDGALRCLPYRSLVEDAGYFQDASCAEPLYRRSIDLGALDDESDPLWRADGGDVQRQSIRSELPDEYGYGYGLFTSASELWGAITRGPLVHFETYARVPYSALTPIQSAFPE